MSGTAWIHERWDGPARLWWSLLIGCILVILSAFLAWIAGRLFGQPVRELLTILLLAELLVLCMMGSGLLVATSRRMSRGGLQRETATIDTDHLPPETREAERRRDQERRDRQTLRAACLALPVLLAFVFLLVF